MKLSIDFSGIIKARESIHAPSAEVVLFKSLDKPKSQSEITLEEKGYVKLTEKTFKEDVEFVGGIPSIGNRPVLLHIYLPHNDIGELTQNPPYEGPRYHFFDCETLERMRQGGRYDRYVATEDPGGGFAVKPKNVKTRKWGKEIKAQLLPCRHCLNALDYDGFLLISEPQQKELVKDLRAKDVLERVRPIFRCRPLYSSATMPDGNYPKDWARISEQTRRRAGWKCTCCRVVLESPKGKGLLHTHHKNGIPGDTKPSNLRVLCALCHKNQPFHGRMQIENHEARFIAEKRKKQGLERSCRECS